MTGGHLGRRLPVVGGLLGETLAQPLPDLLGRVGAALSLRPRDHRTGGGHADEGGQADPFPCPHPSRVNDVSISLEEAVAVARSGDVWLFRGRSVPDRAIQLSTNSPVNHVGMSLVVDDLPPLMWHAELGRSARCQWSGNHHRGAQLHDLHAAVVVWGTRYGQQAWLRQLEPPATRQMENAALRMVARLDGTPFPSQAKLAWRWVRGRAPTLRGSGRERVLETAYCAEIMALTYEAMGLLTAGSRPASWYDPGRFWSGDRLELTGARLGDEIAVDVPGRD